MSRNCDYIMKLGWKEMIQTRCGNMWKQSPSMSISALNCIGDSNILSLLKLSKALRDWCPSIHRSLTQPFLRQGTPVLTLLFLLSCLGWLKAVGGDALDKWLDNDRWGWDWTNNILALWNLGKLDWLKSIYFERLWRYDSRGSHVGAIPPASTGEAKQSGKVRHLSLWSHQICVDALYYHCFPSEAMTNSLFSPFFNYSTDWT